MAGQTRICAEKMRVDRRSPVHRRCCGLWWTWRRCTWRGAGAAGRRPGRRTGRIWRSRIRGLRSLSQEFTQRLEGTVGLCHPQLRLACWTKILSCDLLRVVAQYRKVRILEMKRGAFTVKAGAVGVLDVGACRERRYRPVRQPRENDQEQADGVGDRGGAAPAVPVENRRTVFRSVHDAALTSGKGRRSIVSGIRTMQSFSGHVAWVQHRSPKP